MEYSNIDEIIDEIYCTYFRPLSNFLYKVTHGANFIDDIIQESFIILARKLSSIQDERKMKYYLFKIAYREALRQMEDHAKKKLDNLSDFADRDYHQIAESKKAESVEEDVLKREDSRILSEALFQLSEQDRALVYLKYYLGFQYKEIGKMMNKDPLQLKWRMPSIKSKLYRLVTRMKGNEDE